VAPREARPVAGRVVAVTGAARGIGRATAAALVAQGARVGIGDLDAALARSTADELGGGAVAFELDVTDRQSFESFLDGVERELGPLDVMVNNAGIVHLGPFADEDDASTRRMVDVNLLGVITGTRLALTRLRPGGHLVNVASSAGKITPPGIATYTATKHAVVGLTEAVRLEHRGRGIEFSIVMPGVVNTEMIAGYAQGRFVANVEPEDVAEAIVDALRHPRVEVYVPKSLGPLLRLQRMLPRPVREALDRALKVDSITWNADPAARTAYEARAAASDPGVPPGHD